jgi:hypothetical protein
MRFNTIHATKVAHVYKCFTKTLQERGVYGNRLVHVRGCAMQKAQDLGLFTSEEHLQWKLSQSVSNLKKWNLC